MKYVLKEMNLGGYFTNWVDLIYKRQEARILIAGNYSEAFDIARGVWQGCPLSPLLFNLVIDVLANSLWENEAITGIEISKIMYKQAFYADDTFFFD